MNEMREFCGGRRKRPDRFVGQCGGCVRDQGSCAAANRRVLRITEISSSRKG